jgi:pimeloyl-ACP methyl ester carboxylesterase
MAESWTHHEGVVNNVRLHWVEEGTGPLVVLLHGFPEFWWGWHRQIPALAAAGFRVVAPDMRGYNLSGKPKGAASYRASILVQDVVSLVHHLGEERAHVAGHDWGGVVAWRVALRHPERVDRLVIANAPHPAVFSRELKRPRQFLRSWYAMFFQLPLLPELLFRANDYATLERIFRKSPVRPGAFSDDDVRRYKEAVSRPGALTAMLNYYRAFAHTLGSRGGSGGSAATQTVARPTLVIWGERDTALGIHNLDGLEDYVPDLRIERIPDASHWVLADAPERVSERMIRFLRGGG